MKTRRSAPLTLSLLLLATGIPGAAAQQDDPKEWRDAREPALREHWDDLEGKPAPSLAALSAWTRTDARSWEDLRGKVVLIDMWATWCGPCRAQFPHLRELHERHAKDGLVILGVHSASGYDAAKMRNMIGELELPWSFAADRDGKLGTTLGNKYLPTYYAVDRRGVLRVAGVERSKVAEVVAALLKEKVEAQGPATNWPRHEEKKLWATHDLRGKPAPAFEPGTWLGQAPELKDKVLLIDFWATWCPPCRKAIPKLNALQKEFADDLVVIGLSDESAGEVRAFMQKTTMAYAQAVDPEGRMKKAVGVQGIPHVLVVSSDGVVRWQGYPLDPEYPLTRRVVAAIVEIDRGLRTPPEPDQDPGPGEGGGTPPEQDGLPGGAGN